MLCPVKYSLDTAAILGKLSPEEDGHILDHLLKSRSQRDKAWPRSLALWNQHFPTEPFHLTDDILSAPLVDLDDEVGHPSHFPDPSSLITYDIIAAAKRQMVFHYQVAVMPQYKSPQFLRESVARYFNGYLHLQRNFPLDIWVPTYDIDVVWHTHMMHPVLYKSYTERLRGSLLPHDDTLNDRTPGSKLANRWQATCKAWRAQFNTPVYRPGAMWRGNVSTHERALREDIILQSTKLATQFQPHLDSTCEVWAQKKWVLTEQEERAWRDIEWLHTTQARSLTQESACDYKREASSDMQRFLCIGLNQTQGPLVAACISYFMLKPCCANRADDYVTTIELCRGNGEDGKVRYPLATAHDVMNNSMLNKTAVWQLTGCRRLQGERVLLLRLCGQDFAILGGRWVGFQKQTKLARYSGGNYGSRHEVAGDSRRQGRLVLRIWFLNDKENRTWQTLDKTKVVEDKRKVTSSMTYRCRIRQNPLDPSENIAGQVDLDLKKGGIKVSHSSLGLVGCLLGVCAASLYVGLQPRYEPGAENESMYGEVGMGQSESEMLRGAGGEVMDDEKRWGLSQMRYKQIKQVGKVDASGFFVA